jgi:FtsP/CotA-like multicopper oxidase with cupredoxin domain
MDRRDFLTLAGAAVATGPLVGRQMQMPAPMTPAASGAKEISGTVFNLEIAPVTVELAPNRIVSTIGYNGMSPGPLLRMKEGVPVTVNVVNGPTCRSMSIFTGC